MLLDRGFGDDEVGRDLTGRGRGHECLVREGRPALVHSRADTEGQKPGRFSISRAFRIKGVVLQAEGTALLLIDVQKGGTIQGVIDGLNHILDLAGVSKDFDFCRS